MNRLSARLSNLEAAGEGKGMLVYEAPENMPCDEACALLGIEADDLNRYHLVIHIKRYGDDKAVPRIVSRSD